ncbi:hypothetical protein [Marinicella sp. W31]|uniref:hypothetical protein n=1 Tax=Marinicella sp. W31 TaxID=3023713 RepID=UPI003756B4AC
MTLFIAACGSIFLYSTKSEANFGMMSCRHNGEIFTVLEYGESCEAAHLAISGPTIYHKETAPKIHSADCVVTMDDPINIGD